MELQPGDASGGGASSAARWVAIEVGCDPKTVQGILRHEDVRTTMQLYVRSDQESELEAQGKFLELLLGDKAHLLTETVQ